MTDSRFCLPKRTTCCIRSTATSRPEAFWSKSNSGNRHKCTDSLSALSSENADNSLYRCSDKKGAKGAITLESSYSTEYRVLKADTLSSLMPSPQNLERFNRMYQLVRSSIKSKSLGTTLYKRYSDISLLTPSFKVCKRETIH